jgi:TIR domain
MRGIFISYRREDAEGQAGRLFDDLSEHFGRNAVFMDVAGIKKGLDFRRVIEEHVSSCGVLLVIIGKRWLSVTDGKGKRRLDDANDFVRLETAAALSRGIPVVPVLVQDAARPTEQDLPDALKELAFRNGTELTHARWDSDVKSLIEDLKPYLESTAPAAIAAQPARDPSPAVPQWTPAGGSRPPSRSLWAAGAAVVVVAGFSMFGYPLWQDRPAARDRTLAAAQAVPGPEAQRRPENTVAGPTVATSAIAATPAPKAAAESGRLDPTAAQAEAAKIAAAKAAAESAARAAAARRAAEEKRRQEAERSAQLAEEQRRRDEEARRIALEQAEKNRIAAEQAAAARVFVDIANAVIGGKQNYRR